MEETAGKIAIGSDHAGFEMKEGLKGKFTDWGIGWVDFGTDSSESVDYPDVIHPLAKAVNEGIFEKAVILCSTANGVSMVANKYPNVRAAVCWCPEIAVLARQHNNANMLALPARFIGEEEAANCVKLFLNTPFEGGRHERRVNKIPM